ncbi:formate/nitrite transporter family protein [Streptomyces sp. HC44]|uniref:Formate/nitrite transporter family protein n=1 Tax=Streptomyces scabichelini TaxID=2711217 RepID=A0A6G4VGA8_9ACTN|nr:PH domain-containing protein [Streptomyces scabichelini]NGO13126.1 formate/nitrite transporter family protein [Streptomyces scabichelini]
MTAEPCRRVYRFSGDWVGAWFTLVVSFGGTAALIVYGMAADGIPAAVTIAVGAAFAVGFVLLVLLIHATATISDERHLTIRGMFRRRRTPWPEVQAIEIEANGGSEEAPRWIAVLYDAAGGRYRLPHLNERSRQDFARDVEELREVWMLRRGGDWVPVPAALARMTEVKRHHPVAIAVWVAFMAFWVGWLIDLILVEMGVFDIDDDDYGSAKVLFHPVALMPVVAFIVTLVIVGVRRRG